MNKKKKQIKMYVINKLAAWYLVVAHLYDSQYIL